MVKKKTVSEQGRANRRNGHSWEREVARDMREFFPGACRVIQSRGGTAEGADVSGTPFFIECKTGKNPPLRPALEQARVHCPPDGLPVAIVRRPNKEKVVLMSYETFIQMIRDHFRWAPVQLELGL